MNIELYYTEHGSGFPLILLHGNGEDQSYFIHQIEYFSQFYRVIAVDTRGHGQSPRGTASFTISQFADDLRIFMDRLGLKKSHILGFSDGGNIALTFALRYPERIEKLILNGANLFPAGMKPTVRMAVNVEYIFAKLRKNEYHASLMQLMRKEPNIKPEALRQIQSPTLVIAGCNDMIKERHTKLIASSLPNTELSILPGDHFVARDNSTDFNRSVHKFLVK